MNPYFKSSQKTLPKSLELIYLPSETKQYCPSTRVFFVLFFQCFHKRQVEITISFPTCFYTKESQLLIALYISYTPKIPISFPLLNMYENEYLSSSCFSCFCPPFPKHLAIQFPRKGCLCTSGYVKAVLAIKNSDHDSKFMLFWSWVANFCFNLPRTNLIIVIIKSQL